MLNCPSENLPLIITFVTFGHKHGTPQNTFVNFDLQDLPNPKRSHSLRKGITGVDKDFQEVFWSFDTTEAWYSKFVERIQALIFSIEAGFFLQTINCVFILIYKFTSFNFRRERLL
jgi:RNase adaptor protein for sRNA GlmZ degradation